MLNQTKIMDTNHKINNSAIIEHSKYHIDVKVYIRKKRLQKIKNVVIYPFSF